MCEAERSQWNGELGKKCRIIFLFSIISQNLDAFFLDRDSSENVCLILRIFFSQIRSSLIDCDESVHTYALRHSLASLTSCISDFELSWAFSIYEWLFERNFRVCMWTAIAVLCISRAKMCASFSCHCISIYNDTRCKSARGKNMTLYVIRKKWREKAINKTGKQRIQTKCTEIRGLCAFA